MASLIVLDRSGHTQIDWNPTAVATGDPDAVGAVMEAERVLSEHLKSGSTAVAIASPGQAGVRTDRVDPNVHQTVVIPRLVGG